MINTNNTAAIDLVPSPSSGDSRIVDYLSIYNSDTVTSEITIRFVDNTTNYKLFKVRLSSGEKLEYQEQYGFRVVTNKLSIKTISETEVISDTNFNSVVLRFDVSNVAPNDNAFIDVPELKFSVQAAKKYWFKFWINFTADATTTGSRWFLSGSSTT
ncbi:hypothetical protein EBU71_15120, partial [bacterium]|nr:hypothetical protein [Candidatus Elulimicrobium humile]